MPKKTLELVETLKRENEILHKEIDILTRKYELAVSEREANVKGFTENSPAYCRKCYKERYGE